MCMPSNKCVWGGWLTCRSTCKRQRKKLGVFLCCFLLYSLETKSVSNLKHEVLAPKICLFALDAEIRDLCGHACLFLSAGIIPPLFNLSVCLHIYLPTYLIFKTGTYVTQTSLKFTVLSGSYVSKTQV